MFVCLCHPFSDKTVKKHLASKNGTQASVAETYSTCSGGNKPNCCSCLQTLKDMVQEHNKGTAAA